MSKLSKKAKKIEHDVLKNYTINSPSKLPIENKKYLKIILLKERNCLEIVLNCQNKYLKIKTF